MTDTVKELQSYFNNISCDLSKDIGKSIFYREPDYLSDCPDGVFKILESKGKYSWGLGSCWQIKDYTFEIVDEYGGEGQGDNYWGVAKITKDNEEVFVRLSGWYQSYNGAECDNYNDWELVEPKQVTETKYLPV